MFLHPELKVEGKCGDQNRDRRDFATKFATKFVNKGVINRIEMSIAGLLPPRGPG
jgi:hypothetical protein